jgi:predicted ribosomally synthesized peptide with SipW-like signal peptide
MKKILLSLATIGVVGAIAVSATSAYFSDTATATGNVFTAGTLNLAIAKDSNGTPVGGWLASQNASWNFSNMAPGGTQSVSSVWLKNTGTVDGLHLGLTSANTGTSGFGKQIRITSLTLGGSNLLVGGAGATIGSYVAPTNCTVTISGKITDAIAAANPGDVICAPGTNYSAAWEGVGTIAVNKSVTIVSTQGPDHTASIPFDVTADNVTIRGFSISNPSGSYGVLVNGKSGASVLDNKIHDIGTTLVSGSAQAVYLAGGAGVSGFTVKGNTISHVGNSSLTVSAKGLYIGDSTGAGVITGVTFENNIVSDVSSSRGGYGILIGYGKNTTNLGHVDSAIVKNNSISNLNGAWRTAIGLEGNSPSASVTLNDLHDLGASAVGVHVEDNSGVASIAINNNNVVSIMNSMSLAVNGQSNWWGDQDPSDQVSGSVNTFGFLGGSVAGFVNGTDGNANGYADLQDLATTPLASLAGLNAGEQKQLVMGVQVDGPTTNNDFQGATLTTLLTFTLNQQ